MSEYSSGTAPEKKGGRLSRRAVGGIIIAVLVIVFIAINRDEAQVSFLFFSVTMSLWIALAIATAGGLIAG